ncbi:MAG TPA: 16S rRNA (guanine(966)-N(2))-methyltransferase RsmD [Solirubrobacteraceae bacterium]|jgi:16S rRNA (guanine(966)-N(2))-methyltransferase RsmD
MRIIAGELGGRRLKAPAGRGTRPTAERVREALFAMLGALDGERVLDLFAGSGALGIEALSRGAVHAVFVERDAAAARLLAENLTALDLVGERAELRRADALKALRAASAGAEKYDLIFVDPPYREARRWASELSPILPSLLSADGRIVVESDRRTPLVLELEVERSRRYGDTSITIHTQL